MLFDCFLVSSTCSTSGIIVILSKIPLETRENLYILYKHIGEDLFKELSESHGFHFNTVKMVFEKINLFPISGDVSLIECPICFKNGSPALYKDVFISLCNNLD